jgi:hypothetical protein
MCWNLTFVTAFPFWASPMDLFVLRLRTLSFLLLFFILLLSFILIRPGSPRRHRHHLSRPSSLPFTGTVLTPTSLGLDSSSLPASPPLIVTTPLLAYAISSSRLPLVAVLFVVPCAWASNFFRLLWLGFFRVCGCVVGDARFRASRWGIGSARGGIIGVLEDGPPEVWPGSMKGHGTWHGSTVGSDHALDWTRTAEDRPKGPGFPPTRLVCLGTGGEH